MKRSEKAVAMYRELVAQGVSEHDATNQAVRKYNLRFDTIRNTIVLARLKAEREKQAVQS